ncbi:uncharacterized protein BX664DRAFT_312281 [Halteromyces radiatus]|uniref:uncharacterized protein n=1 Tax=Halteromyces radiatus TaxID=101107 RepID=UPI00221E9FF4|nr:uncharacterized protein BX664DRAFT_312281 [Halteromyces radiatus]KAI8097434.1 hypothetical protein BX664DRAFT_312281 [Halteromyces radiatus]
MISLPVATSMLFLFHTVQSQEMEGSTQYACVSQVILKFEKEVTAKEQYATPARYCLKKLFAQRGDSFSLDLFGMDWMNYEMWENKSFFYGKFLVTYHHRGTCQVQITLSFLADSSSDTTIFSGLV